MSRIGRMLLLAFVFLAGAGGIAAAKGDNTTPSNVTSVGATAVNPEKADGRGVLKEHGLTVKVEADAIIVQINGVRLEPGIVIALLAVIIPAIGSAIYGIWALYKWSAPRWSVKSNRKQQLSVLAKRYKATLREQIEKQSLSTTAFESVSVTLTDTFVPLRLSDSERNETRFMSGRNYTDTSNDFAPLRLSDSEHNETRFMPGRGYTNKSNNAVQSPEAVLRMALKNKYRRLLVIGEPGSGKTTLLYYYALLCLETKPHEKHRFRIPGLAFYLPLRELMRAGEEYALLPANLRVSSEKHSHPVGEDVFIDWLHSATTLVLLDGLDEISDIAQRIKVCDWIDNAVNSFPEAYFIVTSRTTGYRKVDKIELKHFVRVDVMDFTLDQQKRFLHQWFDAAFLEATDSFADKTVAWQKSQKEKARAKAETIIAFLTAEENKSLRLLAGIPLLLQMMAMLWKNRNYLPASRVELYRAALNYTLEYQDKTINNPPLLNPPLLTAEQALSVLTPVSLWMQDELQRDEVDREQMQQQLHLHLSRLDNPPLPPLFCKHLVERAGLLVEYGEREYLFRHKSFREYMAGTQLVKIFELLKAEPPGRKMDGAGKYLRELSAHFGEAWWKEPICFFVAQASTEMFNAFMQQLFESPVSLEFSQEQQDLLERVMQEGPKEELGVLYAKLLDTKTTANQQRYLLKCLQISRHQAAGDVVRQFIEQNLAQDDDIRRRAADFTVTGVVDRQGASYVLIEGGSFVYSVKKKQRTVPNLHVARYTVTNQLYRRFIAYLDGNEAHFATILPLERYKEQLSIMAQGVGGFRRYLKGKDNLAKLFRSYFDDDRKFNGNEQPVIGISWYAAGAYCLWLSLLESNGGNSGHYRLPTEVEWEYAAGGKESRRYPWGEEEPSSTRANYGENEGVTTPVGRYPEGVTPEGLYDMAGNVCEWMGHNYGFGLRGAFYNSNPDALRCSSRLSLIPRLNGVSVGFRVIRSSHSST